MSDKEEQQFVEDLQRGLALSEYRMLREKAMHNQTIVVLDGKNGIVEISAREQFERLYHEPVSTF